VIRLLGLILLLLTLSCQQTDWKESLQLELYSIQNFTLNNRYINKGPIKSPLNTWVEILSFKKDRKKNCLYYKTPYSDKRGILKLTKVVKGKCDPFIEGVTFTKKIESLNFNFLTGSHVEQSNVLELLVSEGKEIQKIQIPLLNYQTKKRYKRFDNQLPNSFIDDVAFGALPGKKKLENGKICHGVNRDCSNVVAYKCEQCEEGIVEVVDYNCPQGGSKYCARNKCGQKNEPACPRGYKVLDSKLASLCFDGSPAGFCEPGLKVFCNNDNILVCL